MIKKIKTAFVVYFSPAGTTHHVAQVIAKTLETSEIEVVLFDLAKGPDDTDLLEAIRNSKNESCLFIGSPVYVSHAVPTVMNFISRLPESINQPVIPFVTWGGATSGIALHEMGTALAKKGRLVVGAAKILALHSMMWRSDTPLGKGRPDGEDDTLIEDMVSNVLDKLSSKPIKGIPLTDLAYYPEKVRAEMEKITISVAKNYMPIREVDEDACTQCEECAATCPTNAITFTPYPDFGESCISCYNCVRLCPETAIRADFSMMEKRIKDRAEQFKEQPFSQLFL